MTKLVLLHRADSVHDDEPDTRYDFPRRYLSVLREGIGDWAIYYEPVKAGPRGYFAVARLADVVPNPASSNRFFALIDPGTFLPFVTGVGRLVGGRPREAALAAPDGSLLRGGAAQSAVRRVSETDFAAIVDVGPPPDLERGDPARSGSTDTDLRDPAAHFVRPVLERLTQRPFRDAAFRHSVRAAYGNRCAMSGLQLRNGGGRPDVQAAHIRPVSEKGGDSVRNGLALSSTLHWMFDRGLVSVAEDARTILVSRNKFPTTPSRGSSGRSSS